MCCLGVRHLVVFMTFVGYLISIGSRSVFTIVITHAINGPNHGQCETTKCKTDPLHQHWDGAFVYYFQTCYYVGYILTQLPGGILSAKFSPRRVSGVTVCLTSLLTIAMRFCIQHNKYAVFVVRFLQGIIEGPNIPAFNGVIALWAPKSEKSVMITIAYAGAYISAAVADYLSGILIHNVSSGSPLFVYGTAGVIWSGLWLGIIYDSPAACESKLGPRERELFQREGHHVTTSKVKFRNIPWKSILTSLPLSAIFVAGFCRNWIFSLLLTQIPKFYKDVYKMGVKEYSLWSAVPHIIMTCVVITCGFVVDAVIKRKWASTTVARKAAETIGFGVESGCLLALGLVTGLSDTQTIILLCVGVAVSGIAISGYQVNPLDLAPQYMAVLTGIVRLGTIGGVISTAIAGPITNGKTHAEIVKDWRTLFIIAGSLHLAGVIYYLIFASGKRQSWAEVPTEISVQADVEASGRIQNVSTEGNSDIEYNSFEERRSLLGHDENEDLEHLLTRSMYVERLLDTSEEDETPSWYMSTI